MMHDSITNEVLPLCVDTEVGRLRPKRTGHRPYGDAVGSRRPLNARRCRNECLDDVKLPEHWRVYGDPVAVDALLGAGFGTTLDHAGRRDLVIELIDALVIVYPAARDVIGADAFADLTTTALAIADGVLACSPTLSPRGVE